MIATHRPPIAHRFAHLGLLLSLGLGISMDSAQAIDLSPSKIQVGKAAEVSIDLEGANNIRQLSLQPGGPYLQRELALAQPDHGDIKIETKDGNWVLKDNFGQGVAQFSAKTEATSGELRFVASGTDGLRIFKDHKRKSKLLGHYRANDAVLDVELSGDGLAFIAAGDNGLVVLDVENPAQPLWLGSHQKLGRAVKVSAKGRQVAVLNDAGIIFLLDCSNPVEPTTVGAYRSQRALHDISLLTSPIGAEVYALGNELLQVINFDAEAPQLSNEGLDFGQGVNFGGERRVYIENKLAYVADWFSGIHIYDLSNPKLPQLLSSFHTPGSPKGMIVRDGVAFVPDDDHGLQIIDVSDPTTPTLLSHLQTRGLGYTPRIVGDLLYLASHHGGFQIIDISDVRQPRQIGEFDTPGKAWSLEVRDELAYIADDDSGLLIFDVSNPTTPEPVGQYFTGAAAEEVLLRDNIAFVAFFDDGLHVLDISNPRAPQLISKLALPGNTRGLDLVGDTLFVAGWLAGVQAVDVSNLKQPTLLSSIDTRGATWGLKVDADYLYAMDWWGGIAVLDVSDASHLRTVGGYHEHGHVHHIASRDNYAFAAHGSIGLQVFDIKNPLHPTWTSGAHFPGQARAVAIHGERAYVAAGDGGLAVVDISNPFNIRWLASANSDGESHAVAADDKYAYLLDEREGLIVFDIRSGQPRKLDRLGGQFNDLWLYQGVVYLAADDGVHAVRLEEGRLQDISHRPLTNSAHSITGDSRHLYIGAGSEIISLKRRFDLEASGTLTLPQAATDIWIEGEQLFASTAQALYNIDARDPSRLSINQHYPLLARASAIHLHDGVAYISGEETITALRPMPVLQLPTEGAQQATLKLPATLAIGGYHLRVDYSDGRSALIHNALRVKMPKFSKPKMTMDDFNKLMEINKDSDIFVKPQSVAE